MAARWMGVAALALLAAGCSQQEQVALDLQPAQVSECDLPVSVQVTWNVLLPGVEAVELHVNNPGRRPMLWTQTAAFGSQHTDAWAADGFTVTLRTLEGRELARRTLTTTACADAAL